MEKYSNEDLEMIEDLAKLFFTPREIAIMIERDPNDVIYEIESGNGDVFAAFHRGRLQSEVDLRKGVLQLAKAGSSPAQTMAMDLLNKSKAKMLDR